MRAIEDLQNTKSWLSEESAVPASAGRLVRFARRGHYALLGKGSVNRRIFTAMLTVGALSVVVKLVSMSKEMTVAHTFGTSDGFDALLMAYVLPSFAITVIAGALNAALIPTYIQVRDNEGKEAAQQLFSTTMVWSTALLIAVAVLIGGSASYTLPLLASGFSPEKLALTTNLMLLLLPLLPLSGLFVMWAAVLNAGECFKLAALSPVMTPLAIILIVGLRGDAWGVRAIAFAMMIGSALEGFLLANSLRRQGVSIQPRWYGLTPATKQVMRQYAPMIAGSSLMSSSNLVDQSMAAMLGPGSISILSYGSKVSAVVVSIGATAVSTAILPQFSRMAAAKNWSGVRHTLKTYTRVLLMVTIPLTLVLVLTSRFLVAHLFERGAFTANDTLTVSAVQTFYVLQLPFYVTGRLFVRLTSALKASHILMWGTCISFVINIVLDYVLMRWLGVAGIALSTSFVYLASFTYLWLMSRRALRLAEERQ